MKIKKIAITIISILIATLPFLLYLVNVRWGGADSFSYIQPIKEGLAIRVGDSYILSGLLFSPFLLLSGFNPDSLIFASVVYRAFFTFAFPRPAYYPLIAITAFSFIFFPLHTLISFFPGKDIFSYGFFILLVYSVLESKPFWSWACFSFLVFLFRAPLGIFLLLFCLSFWVYSRFFTRLRVRAGMAVVFSAVSIPLFASLILLLFQGYAIAALQERIAIDVSQGYFNIVGHKSFPLNTLNIFFPLLSSNPLSVYSLLSLENMVALFFICRVFLLRHASSCVVAFKILSFFVILYSVSFSALWPNITDAARKIYPLLFCGSASFLIVRRARFQ